jgi:uncharacterized protein (TIGR02757 family)
VPIVDRAWLEGLHASLNRREYVHPDPLEFLYRYEDTRDREIAGLVASSLAYGRVKQILRSVGLVLERMGPSPAAFLADSKPGLVRRAFDGFKHRFTTGAEIGDLLVGARGVLADCGSLEACFADGMADDADTVAPALCSFVDRLARAAGGRPASLLPLPGKGSACKRLNLFLRWMVRSDDVDPGGWTRVSPSKLIVPLDTHMHRISRALGLTTRNQADMRTALEITNGFREFAPEDPVKYDFAITRLGIRSDMCLETMSDQLGSEVTV